MPPDSVYWWMVCVFLTRQLLQDAYLCVCFSAFSAETNPKPATSSISEDIDALLEELLEEDHENSSHPKVNIFVSSAGRSYK